MDDSNWSQQQNGNPSSTGSDSYANQGPGAGTNPDTFNQSIGQGGAYDNMQSSQQHDMGGGQGAMGSGVAGGEGGSTQNQQSTQSQTGEKQNWLNKGLEKLGARAGVNMNNTQANSASEFINKEFKQYSGRDLPGVE